MSEKEKEVELGLALRLLPLCMGHDQVRHDESLDSE